MEKTAQVKSSLIKVLSQLIPRVLFCTPYVLVSHRSFLAHVELVVDTILLYLECSPADLLVVFICFQILTSVHLKTSAT